MDKYLLDVLAKAGLTLTPDQQDAFVRAADIICADSANEGYDVGFADGYDDGFADGRD